MTSRLHVSACIVRSILLLGAFAAVPDERGVAAESGASATPPPAVHAETKAERDLREVVARERAIWDRLRAQPEDDDAQRRANAEFRDVLTTYENILRASPEFAEAYAAYGLLLNRTGQREEAAKAFLRANKLNPNLALVKNQLGNYLVEEGKYAEALRYYLAAIELEPDEPLYHYQLGTLLHEFERLLLADGVFDRATLDAKMQAAFHRAAELSPDTWGYIYRYAESFYDVASPDWATALAEWQKLEPRAKPGIETETVRLHEARVLIALDRRDDARALLDTVTEPALATSKQTVVEMLEASPAK